GRNCVRAREVAPLVAGIRRSPAGNLAAPALANRSFGWTRLGRAAPSAQRAWFQEARRLPLGSWSSRERLGRRCALRRTPCVIASAGIHESEAECEETRAGARHFDGDSRAHRAVGFFSRMRTREARARNLSRAPCGRSGGDVSVPSAPRGGTGRTGGDA